MPRYSICFGEYVIRHARLSVIAGDIEGAKSAARDIIRTRARPFAFEYAQTGTAPFFVDALLPDGTIVDLAAAPVSQLDQVFGANADQARLTHSAPELLRISTRFLAWSDSAGPGLLSTSVLSELVPLARNVVRAATAIDLAYPEPELFENHYQCSRCGETWQDEWTASCDDRCPRCGQSTSPFLSRDGQSSAA